MRDSPKSVAPAPAVPEVPVHPRVFEEHEAALGFAGRFFPGVEPAAKRSGSDVEFGGFRPVLGRPDSVEGEQALLEVMRAFDDERSIPSDEIIHHSAELLAQVSFPGDPEGHALTLKLIRSILRRELDAFGVADRLQFARAVGRREFPEDIRLAELQTRWVGGAVDPGEARELEIALSRRGVGIHELVARRLWVRGEPSSLVFEDDVPGGLARFLENRSLSLGPLNPPEEPAP